MRLRLPIHRETPPRQGRPPLPGRVRDAIRRQQASSEIVVGWIQLAIVVTFSILYALSPKPYTAEPVFAPEPWVLGAYLLFTLVRVVLAHRRALPAWLLYVSVVLDMLLLLALIWSIHVKYGQPASFYLKVPTLLYVFIFIALRALRFEARYVLLAGAVAAGGWLLMVLYAVSIVPDDPMITRDYVEYMTSNSVLLGAEFDKVISILIVTGILAVAITPRARPAGSIGRGEHRRGRAVALRAKRGGGAGQGIRDAGRSGRGRGPRDDDLLQRPRRFHHLERGHVAGRPDLHPQRVLRGGDRADRPPRGSHQPVPGRCHPRDLQSSHRAGGPPPRTRCGPRSRSNTSSPRAPSGQVSGSCRGSGSTPASWSAGSSVHRTGLGYTRTRRDDVNLAARLEALNKEHGTRIIVSGRTPRARGPRALRVRGDRNGDGAGAEPVGHRLQDRRLRQVRAWPRSRGTAPGGLIRVTREPVPPSRAPSARSGRTRAPRASCAAAGYGRRRCAPRCRRCCPQNPVEKLAAGEHTLGMAHEEVEHAEFGRSGADGLAPRR